MSSIDNPIVSVLIPSLNNEDYIAECINSVINQTLDNIEIICIDAGSTDNTLEIIKSFAKMDSRIKIIKSDKRSYGYQMNLGLKKASGQYIGIVESDDYIDKNMYEQLISLSNNGEMDIVKSTFFHVYEEGELKMKVDWSKKELKNVDNPFNIYNQEKFLDGHPSIWAGIYNRDFLIRNNIYFLEEKGAGWVDNPFFYETAFAAEKIVYIAVPFYYYRESNPNSSSNALGDFTIPIRRMIDNLNIVEKYNCKDKDVLHVVYVRAFAYIANVFRRDGYENHMGELMPLIHRMLLMLDENIILEKFNYKSQETYYKFLSPLHIIEGNNHVLTTDEHELLIKENDFLYDRISKLSKYNEKLKSDIKKEKRSNKKLKSIKSSKSFKLGSYFALPIHKIKQSKNHLKNRMYKNILFIPSDNSRTSGAFISMVNLIVQLRAKYKLNIHVIIPNKGNGDELLKSEGIDYTLIPSNDWVIPLSHEKDESLLQEIENKKAKNNKAIQKIKNYIIENNIDLVHINTTYSYVGAIAAIETNTPFVWHLREFLEEDQSNTLWDRKKGNELINKSNKVIAISDSIYNKYSTIFDKDKLVKIYNGIDAKKFYKPDKNILSNDKIIFIFVGGFEYYKGQIEFANACAKLYDDGFKDFEIWFIGTGKDEVKYQVQNILSSLDSNQVKYLGYKKNVEEYFMKSDISFTCAKSEAFGRTTVEAMLSGNLVIGADSAGTKELINDGVTGILYSQGDSNDLCLKIKDAIINIEKSKEIAKNGRAYMESNMTAEKNAENVYKLYKEIL